MLVIGGGPAGLEATRALGQRGYKVILAEAKRELGGRVSREARLPGLSEWIRVRDYRTRQIQQMPNVEVYLDNQITADDALAVEAGHIVIATGASWRNDGFGRFNASAITNEPFGPASQIFTPDDIMDGSLPDGAVAVFDDDGYYHASTIAEKLALLGLPVTYITPANEVSTWSRYTSEQARVQRRLMELGIEIVTGHGVTGFDGADLVLQCAYSGRKSRRSIQNLVTVTSRLPIDSLYHELELTLEKEPKKHPPTITKIGDCDAPSIIASAVFTGHRYARELDRVVEISSVNLSDMKYDRVFFTQVE